MQTDSLTDARKIACPQNRLDDTRMYSKSIDIKNYQKDLCETVSLNLK